MLKSLEMFAKSNSVPLYVLATVACALTIAANVDNRVAHSGQPAGKTGESGTGHSEAVGKTENDALPLQPAAAQALAPLDWQPLPPANKPVIKIAFGSCLHQNKPQPIWQSIAATSPDLFLMLGDNVYSDIKSADSRELKTAYATLAGRPEFELARNAFPILATWDDHDYGGNDAGADFQHKDAARALFLEFWKGSGSTSGVGPGGVYYAKRFGPAGQRVQIVMLDTRSFRSDLLRTANKERGKGRYRPDPSPNKTLLGAEQWAWLEQELRKPAALRIIASSIQVLADGHAWERWGNLPGERRRLFELIGKTKASGVVFISGDRHRAAVYRNSSDGPYTLYEITSSAMNMPISKPSDESGPYQLEQMYTKENFGLISVDWKTSTLEMTVRDLDGKAVRAARKVDLSDLVLQ